MGCCFPQRSWRCSIVHTEQGCLNSTDDITHDTNCWNNLSDDNTPCGSKLLKIRTKDQTITIIGTNSTFSSGWSGNRSPKAETCNMKIATGIIYIGKSPIKRPISKNLWIRRKTVIVIKDVNLSIICICRLSVFGFCSRLGVYWNYINMYLYIFCRRGTRRVIYFFMQKKRLKRSTFSSWK